MKGGMRVRRAFLLLAFALALWSAVLAHEALPASAPSAAPQKKWILIELDLKRLTLYQGTTVLKRYPIASGAWSTPSPIGVFTVIGRFKTEMSGFGTRFLRLNVPWCVYGIHGTNRPDSIGANASHGCIRLRVADAEALYAMVPNGTRVYLEGGPYGPLGDSLRTLRPGDRGSHVREVQLRLRQQGFLHGSADGVYGEATSRAVLAARKSYHLRNEDIVDGALYTCLGILLFE